MTGLHLPFQAALHRTRIVVGTLAALVLLAAASAVAAPPVGSDQFAPGWQAHLRPLFDMGPSRDPGRNRWYVSSLIPRGDYVLVHRTGDKAELIQGQRLRVEDANVDQYVFVDGWYHDVEALPIADVPSLKPRPGARRME